LPRMIRAANLVQSEIPGIRHTGDVLEEQSGKIPWMSRNLATRYYAGIFELRDERRGVENQSWMRTYQQLRDVMGLGWTVDLPPAYRRDYLGDR